MTERESGSRIGDVPRTPVLPKNELRAVETAARHVARADVELVDAMRRARSAGASLRAIAIAAGTTHERVRVLLGEAKWTKDGGRSSRPRPRSRG
jgi:hypothetical protein